MYSNVKPNNDIPMNLTRTRLTILVFNLTIISLMIKMSSGTIVSSETMSLTNLTSSLASFFGFCLTLLGILLFLYSQRLDSIGNSKLTPYLLASVTTYLALSQTITAFMHEFLVRFKSHVHENSNAEEGIQSAIVEIGNSSMVFLYIFGGVLWILVTYFAPVSTLIKSSVPIRKRWPYGFYYLMLQVPIYWVYAKAWNLEYISSEENVNILYLFVLQFIQPILWVIS